MSRENVVPFQPSDRSGMRRGAPDKRQEPSLNTLEVECPRCAAVLCFEAGLPSVDPEILCTGCGSVIPVGDGKRVNRRG